MMLNRVIKAIEKQQKELEGTPAFFVGEQLKEMLKNGPASHCELVLKDLDVKEMSISCCEKEIKKYADEHRTGNFSFVSPKIAEEIIRKFYGIELQQIAEAKSDSVFDLADFL